MKMEIIQTDGSYTHIKLTGKLDIAAVEQIDIKFTAHVAAARKPAIIDISGLDFLSSLGLRTILSNAKALIAAQKKMVLMNPQPLVMRVVETAGILPFIPVAKTVDEALTLIA